ncbi:hypothetical protein RhiirA5_422605 [Rhizophagus irregularis]|uniref:Uncharacterized protein n=1 Tax=Rhizophagus irregularis TaxID=588596 RepID=A0A2N0PBJ7_9GLOM|nr:hypothetical protein RhiirA5_422605 [Rhizophagus irregularis]CAB5211700.1 unnamed protein product [Rhizophagus irregularis]
MISRKLLLLATVALFCMIFIGSTQTAPLNKRQAVVYVDFEDEITGQWTWTSDGFDFVKRADGDFYRFRGLFTRGFEKDTNIQNYEFFVITKDRQKIDYTQDIIENVKISSAGGTSPFQKVYEGFKVSDFVGGTFFVKHKGKKFSEATIKLP